MSDAEVIGAILVSRICILEDMHKYGELSDSTYHACLILIKSINTLCKKNNIDLCMEQRWDDYIKNIISDGY